MACRPQHVGVRRRAEEIDAKLLLRGKAHELPVVGKGTPVAIAEMIKDDAPTRP